jgi:hypothetical protein
LPRRRLVPPGVDDAIERLIAVASVLHPLRVAQVVVEPGRRLDTVDTNRDERLLVVARELELSLERL